MNRVLDESGCWVPRDIHGALKPFDNLYVILEMLVQLAVERNWKAEAEAEAQPLAARESR